MARRAANKTTGGGTIETLCGGRSFVSGEQATTACLNVIHGVAADRNGNVYLSDKENGRVLVRRPDGKLYSFAGTGRNSFSGDNGPAINAELHQPFGLAIGNSGEVFIADTGNGRIRKVDAAGTITTLAGNGSQTALPAGDLAARAIPGIQVPLLFPVGLLFDGVNALWITDVVAGRVYRLDLGSGLIQLVMTKEQGGPFDPTWLVIVGKELLVVDRSASKIRSFDMDTKKVKDWLGGAFDRSPFKLSLPTGIVFDGRKFIYVSDQALGRILQIDVTTKQMLSYAGDGGEGFTGDGGPANQARFFRPDSLTLGPDGTLYVADRLNYRVRAIAPTGTVQTVAGCEIGDGGSATKAWLQFPRGLAVNSEGHIYVCDCQNRRVRRIDSKTGKIDTVAGSGFTTGGEIGKSPLEAAFYSPRGIALDSKGILYVADANNNGVWRIDFSANRIDFAARDPRIKVPTEVAVGSMDELYVADWHGHVIWKVGNNGALTVFAGQEGKSGFSGDGGPAAQALLDAPLGLACGKDGSVYISDHNNRRIRVVRNGVISTHAGSGEDGVGGDDGPALKAQLNAPMSLHCDNNDDLWIADQYRRIRQVEKATGIIRHKAGSLTRGHTGDGGPAIGSAQLNTPLGIAVFNGDLYFVDSCNHSVRKVTGV